MIGRLPADACLLCELRIESLGVASGLLRLHGRCAIALTRHYWRVSDDLWSEGLVVLESP
jgi:hypothetical protein